jgi:DNA repair exonuclease SbcCD ATPase subunit
VRIAFWLLFCVVLTVVGACRSTPREPSAAFAATQCRNPQLESLGTYALALRQQDETSLLAEKEKLEATPASVDRDLRLAVLLGQQGSPVYDPQSALRLLSQLSSSAPPDSVQKAFVDVLFAGLPGVAQTCADSDEFRELAAQLSAEQHKRQDTAARLENVRQELEAERAQREKLEQQLEALKTLEEQIKNRDNGTGR